MTTAKELTQKSNATLSLRQWITGALESTRSVDGGSLTGSSSRMLSPDYLASSLRIALRLSEQICKAEELSKFGLVDKLDALPLVGTDWADCVRVHLGVNADAPGRLHSLCPENDPYSLEIQPFASNVISDDSTSATTGDPNDEMQSFLDFFGFGTDVDTFHDGISPATHTAQGLGYFNIISSEIIPVENDSTFLSPSDSNRSKERVQRIHNLGLVFYELFSGEQWRPCSKAGSPLQIETALLIADEDDGPRERDPFAGINTNSRKRHACQASRQQVVPVQQVSVEYLSFKGIPSSLSYLISNMIDSINGDLSRDEAYTNIFHVASDIRLMIENPSTYLQELDLEKLSLTGLELNEALFGREEEYASLELAYKGCMVSGSAEIALISGESGIGKSSLAERLGRAITVNGGLFLSGKFQKHKSKPFSALASAFDEYCQVLVRERDSDWASAVISRLQMVLCNDSYHLIEVIPTLSQILVCTDTASSNENSVNAQNRLNHLMCEFVETICSYSAIVVTLFLDDVQWADTASISVLSQVLKRSRSFAGGFFFLGCCRDDEMQDDHPFRNMVDTVRRFGVTARTVTLDCMDKETVNRMISELLRLPPRLVRSLAEIVFQKTKGNPLFFTQLLLSLNRDGLLHLSLPRRRWVWDEEKIMARSLPDDVALFFTNSIQKLPDDAQSALFTLSCFGGSVECGIIEELERNLGVPLIGPLKIAKEECLVKRIDKMFHFCHDRIQESAYSAIEVGERHFHHAKYGHALVVTALKSRNDSILFAAVGQIILGGHSAVSNDEQRVTIAQYTLAAGKRAIVMSDFTSALSFLTSGISFLPHNHWNDNYELSLELFELAARCSLATGDMDGLSVLSDKVINHAKCFEDKLDTSFTVMSAFAYSSKVAKSVEMGLMIVLKLGVDIPKLSHEETVKRIRSTQNMLTISDADLLNYRLMSDSRQLMAMKFLAKLQNAVHQIKPGLQPIIAISMVELTIASGLSPMSPIGFACFGGLVAKLNDIRGGYRFAKLAKALVDKLESNEVSGEVTWLSTEIISFVEPLQTSNELRVQGVAVAMAAGDVHWACWNRMSTAINLLWTGANLSQAKETCSKAICFMEEQGHRTTLYYVRSSQKSILSLIGDTSGSIPDDALAKGVVENKNPRQLMILFYQKMFLSFMLDRDDMKVYAEKFFENRLMTWFLMSNQAFQLFISGLVSFLLYRVTHDPVWAERGARSKSNLQLWATEGSSWNFEHKFFLLQAEEFYCNKRFDEAAVTYSKAISSASAHKFINDEALARELAGKFYLETGNLQTSLEHFTVAHEKYQQWGAYAKADLLFTRIQEKFSSALC